MYSKHLKLPAEFSSSFRILVQTKKGGTFYHLLNFLKIRLSFCQAAAGSVSSTMEVFYYYIFSTSLSCLKGLVPVFCVRLFVCLFKIDGLLTLL